MGVGGQDETAFAFEGRLAEFVPIALTNIVLTFATLGIYRFWATTRERAWFWSRTRFIDAPLEWTGKGIELFIGFVIAAVLFGLPFLVFNLLLQGLILQGQPLIAGLLIFGLYVLLLFLAGIAIFRGLRYRLSRTSWRGIHGGSDDNGVAYGGAYLAKTAVGFLAAGLLIPWSMTALWRDRWSRMSFGPHMFESQPTWTKLMGRYLIAYLAPVVILIGLVIAMIPLLMVAGTQVQPGSPPPPGIIIAIIAVVMLGFYIIWPLAALAYYSAYTREVIGTLRLSTLEFAFTARTKHWIALFLGNAGIWAIAFLIAAIPIGALGLFDNFVPSAPGDNPLRDNPVAYLTLILALIVPFAIVGPFIRYRNWRFFIRYMEAGGEIDIASLTQSKTAGMTQGEGLLDAFDMGAI